MKINNSIYMILLFSAFSASSCNLFSKNDSPTTSQNLETITNTTDIIIDSTLIDTTLTIDIKGSWFGTYRDVESSEPNYSLKSGRLELTYYTLSSTLDLKFCYKTFEGLYQSDGSFQNIKVNGNSVTFTKTENLTDFHPYNNRRIKATTVFNIFANVR